MATAITHFNATTRTTFAINLMNAQVAHKHIREATTDSIHVYDADHNGAEYYISEDCESGFAIKANGELCMVFSTVKGRGAHLIKNAIYRGATHLDCFDGFLPTFYAKHGFIEVGSEPNYNGAHLPRVVYMALVG